MGTRADMYVGRGENAEWLGSIANDGYPAMLDLDIKEATTVEEFREAVAAVLDEGDDATKPEMGWPWPWTDSNGTDYAYAFDDGKVWCSHFGNDWFDANGPEPTFRGEKVAVFPNMEKIQRVTFGPRSGVTVLGI